MLVLKKIKKKKAGVAADTDKRKEDRRRGRKMREWFAHRYTQRTLLLWLTLGTKLMTLHYWLFETAAVHGRDEDAWTGLMARLLVPQIQATEDAVCTLQSGKAGMWCKRPLVALAGVFLWPTPHVASGLPPRGTCLHQYAHGELVSSIHCFIPVVAVEAELYIRRHTYHGGKEGYCTGILGC